LGYTALYRGDIEQAVSFLKEALALSKRWEDKVSLALCLAGFAAVAVVHGNVNDSALLFGAMDSQVQRLIADGHILDSPLSPHNRRKLERYQEL
jgi:hypothetical protein